ncbi:mannose-6-phosphate isomerase [Sabethes cyaneus]|uniref:mannose-6-phosphate isomerase n=1 Tax=Sabethes cyaneus TaxID=53552 RepID=UPI00237D6B60|nr:mannose-6-phosphate isomerase [Sabethes cyaneus]
MELIGHVMHYEWGKLGEDSYVAKLAAANRSDDDTPFVVDASKPYAELWMGDHCSGPSLVKKSGKELGSVLRPHEKPTFLFKVLSVRKALSIQVHPNKRQAAKLHAQFPDIYKDPNHKPELAIALTDFQAMCGFRPYDEIYSNLKAWPELQDLLGADQIEKLTLNADDDEVLRNLYASLMHSEPEQLEKCISKMHSKIRTKPDKCSLDQLFLQLHQDFGNDVGLLSIYFLNVLDLQPGQAIYLSANVPHAYLRGDCVECMACSDNVVRAGLTPKFKDVDTLLELLVCQGAPAQSMLCRSVVKDPERQPYTRTFLPNDLWLTDFVVSMLKIPTGVKTYPVSNALNGCILLICSGKGLLRGGKNIALNVQFGSIIFVPSDASAELELCIENTGEEFVAYQAMQKDFI